jgi:PTH1 family peptidyl-tRNA hydrolase
LVTKADLRDSLILAKPQTYMNLSGQSIGALMKFYKVPPEHLLVVYDEVDLPLGTIRLRPAGGSAGQKGMKSIIERLGTENLSRLRIGIGRPPGRKEAGDYVLQDFSKQEERTFRLSLTVPLMPCWSSSCRIEPAMNQYNGAGEDGSRG